MPPSPSITADTRAPERSVPVVVAAGTILNQVTPADIAAWSELATQPVLDAPLPRITAPPREFREINDSFFVALGDSGSVASRMAVNDFMRIKMREDGFYRRIIPPLSLEGTIDIGLDLAAASEPDSNAAMVPWIADIRRILTENAIRDMLSESDRLDAAVVSVAIPEPAREPVPFVELPAINYIRGPRYTITFNCGIVMPQPQIGANRLAPVVVPYGRPIRPRRRIIDLGRARPAIRPGPAPYVASGASPGVIRVSDALFRPRQRIIDVRDQPEGQAVAVDNVNDFTHPGA